MSIKFKNEPARLDVLQRLANGGGGQGQVPQPR
jgi:hypothetical protein